jgi:hypothetical protein
MGSAAGVAKVAAKRIGVSIDEYESRISDGEKWCTECKAWRDRLMFAIDRSRGDGLRATCSYDVETGKRLTISEAVTRSWESRLRASPLKGRTMSIDARQAMSASQIERHARGEGRPRGWRHTVESRVKMSASMRESARRGAANVNYKDGLTPERRGIRFSTPYARWRVDVFMRDAFTCRDCGDNRGGNLNAHHIKSFADFPELRLDIENGVTLCSGCHKKRHRSG